MAIKIRRGLNTDRLTVLLEEGEVAYTTDTKKFYIGDGITLGGNEIGADPTTWGSITGTLSAQTDLQSALNAKQATLVSGTNIKTINSTSLLGSGNVSVQPTLVSGTNIKTLEGQSLLGSGNIDLTKSDVGLGNVDNTSDANKPVSTATQTALNLKQNLLGYTPLAGVHSIIPIASGSTTFNGITANITTATGSALNVRVAPYIPAQSFTTSSLFINVSTATAGSLCTIVVYSDVNGVPTNLLYESADLDCSTTGLKTATTSFSFVAGTVYWLGLKSNATLSTRFHLSAASALPLNMLNANSMVSYQRSSITYTSPSPSPLAGSLNTGTAAAIYIIKA